jgi:hypothetical protein
MVGGCGRPGASRGVLSFSLRSPLTEPFERTISVEGGADAALADKLIEIAGKCPVHRTPEAGAAVVTKVAGQRRRGSPACDGSRAPARARLPRSGNRHDLGPIVDLTNFHSRAFLGFNQQRTRLAEHCLKLWEVDQVD